MARVYFLLLLNGFFLPGCRPDPPEPSANARNWPGGANTVFETGALAYSLPSPVLRSDDLMRHRAGEAVFRAVFSEDPAAPFPGLGPLYIHHSCAECHAGNGRSHPPLQEDDNSSGLLLRLSVAGVGPHGEPLGIPGYGTQLQTLATGGGTPEGRFFVEWDMLESALADGSVVTLRQPYYTFYSTYAPLPGDALRSGRNAPPVFGLGLLEAIPEAEILAREDPGDADGDYISGRANTVWDYRAGRMTTGRFGWKAGSPTIVQQAAEALLQDMGITTAEYFESEACTGQSNCAEPHAPDLDEASLEVLAHYLRTLAVPAARDQDDPAVMRGRAVFSEIGCAGCHVPEWKTGPSPVSVLSHQVIHPYTDLLLHDLGEGLGDGRPEYEAGANEWRTPPLWGIGLSARTSPLGTYLHDGRAGTLTEAILWHGGEALESRNAFRALPVSDRNALLKFLESL